MTTLSKLIIATILGLVMSSCNIDASFGGVRGNGNVSTETRKVEGSFDEIKVSRGLDVYLTQGSTENITIEADENLHDIIMTKIENNILKIYANQNIPYSKSQKVLVTFQDISKITASSGSDVFSTNIITADALELNTESGSDMHLEVEANSIDCQTTSGSDLRLSGTTETLYAMASSGGNIKAAKLKAIETTAKASSGADITVNTAKALTAKASSGGDIKYYGDPEQVEKTDGVSGSVRKQ
jgi:hypothetical protein